jgi:N-acetylmuramoyl-L-alanine amidase
MVKKLKYFGLVLAVLITCGAFTWHTKFVGNGIKIIVIDPGHGGKDPGCLGSIHREKEVSLEVALKLGKYIEQNFKDVKVIYTRTTDVFVELEDRAQIANKAKADLFISIHCNAAGKPVMVKDAKTGKKRPKMYKSKNGKLRMVETTNPLPFGTETYVMGLKNEEGKMKVATRENSAIFYEDDYEKKYGGFDPESEESYIIMSNYTSAYVIQSASLAMKIQEEYSKKAGRIDKGVHRQSIWVLWRTSMPSILTEIGYLTNPLEEKFLGSETGQEYIAKALFRGLRKYKDEVEGLKREYNDEFENQVALENENIKAGNIPGQKKVMEEDEDDETDAAKPIEDTASKQLTNKTRFELDKAKKAEADSIQRNKELTEKNKQDALVKQQLEDRIKEANDQKQVVNDDKYEEIVLEKKEDSKPVNSSKDTALSATEIAKKFKEEKRAEPILMDKATKESKLSEIEKKKTELNTEILFKVQFATSDIPLNLKQEKFAAIKDADFYKLNGALKYTSGKFVTLKDALTHQAMLREKGFKDCFVIALNKGVRMDLAEARKITGQ